jgi:hypothetical protein
MVMVHITGLDMSGILGYIFLVFCMVVLFLEFFKSGDINVWTFLVDLIFSVSALVVATVLISYLIFTSDNALTFFDWFGAAIILGDAILSPFNAFRTALRNVHMM